MTYENSKRVGGEGGEERKPGRDVHESRERIYEPYYRLLLHTCQVL